MTTQLDPARAQATGTTVTVAWVGTDVAPLRAVQDNLLRLAPADAADEPIWSVVDAATLPPATPVHLAVCPDTMTTACVQRWPEATVLTLVPVHDDGRATLAALAAGAAVSVRGTDPSLIAAYLRAMVRRRITQELTP